MNFIDFVPAGAHALLTGLHLFRPKPRANSDFVPLITVEPRLFDDYPALRKDVVLLKLKGFGAFLSTGVNLTTLFNNCAVITVDKEIYDKEPDGVRFFIRREMHLLERNVPVKTQALKTITSLVCVLIGDDSMLGTAIKIGAYLLTSKLVEDLYCNWAKEEALQYALPRASRTELAGALRLMADNKNCSAYKAVQQRLGVVN